MITQEHLEHWLNEIQWQLNGILKEIDPKKLEYKSGISIELADDKRCFVSFEYLQEKALTIQQLKKCIEDDIKNDGA